MTRNPERAADSGLAGGPKLALQIRLLLFYIVPHRKVNTPTLTNYFKREVLKIRFCRLWLQEAVAFYNVFPQWTYYKFMKGVTWAYSSR